MSKLRIGAVAGGVALAFAVGGTTDVFAQKAAKKPAMTCVKKAGSGTNTTKDGALFQAWEAVLQATDWGSWSTFMATGAKVGTAPGYKVSGIGQKCQAGGLGQTCKMQATLCK
jgi:hypothetical protein